MALNPNNQIERFDARDIIQSAVGSLAGALIYAYQTNITGLSDSLPFINSFFIVIITLILAFLISYGIGVRRLGKKKIRILFGPIPLRITIHYSFALIFSAFMLWLLAINTSGTPLDVAMNRIIVLSLPATLLGSTIDLVESQKG